MVNWPEKNGRITKFSVLDHFGTHVDAPIHTVRDGADLSGVDIGGLIGEAVILDMYKGGVDYGYTAEDFEAQAEHVRAGDIVLIYSGYEPCRSVDDPIRQTFVTPEAAQWLVDHGVRAVGCEPAGLEHGSKGYFEYRWYDLDTPNPPSWPAHGILLSKRRVHHRGARQPRPSQGPAGTVRGASPERSRALRLPRASRCLDRALSASSRKTVIVLAAKSKPGKDQGAFVRRKRARPRTQHGAGLQRQGTRVSAGSTIKRDHRLPPLRDHHPGR